MKRCEVRLLKKTCTRCHVRKARVSRDGRVFWERRNVLCFECQRAVQNRMRSEALASDRSFQLLLTLEAAPERAELVLRPLNANFSSEQSLLPEIYFNPSTKERWTYELERA